MLQELLSLQRRVIFDRFSKGLTITLFCDATYATLVIVCTFPDESLSGECSEDD